jgi:glycosyltransferase involved in cell wall biosynthesis
VSTWHLLAPEYPPGCGGVGDYTALVAAGLAATGDDVHVWHPGGVPDPVVNSAANGVHVHRLPDRFGSKSRNAIDAALSVTPGIVVVEYVPGVFGARGMNLPFCRWLARLRRGGVDVRVMFHEPFFYFGFVRPWRNVLAVVQRVMAWMLLRASARVYYPTETWTRLLAPYGPQDHVEVLPIPATIPTSASAEAIDRARGRRRGPFVVGHFGTYGDHVGRELQAILPGLLRRLPAARVLLVGDGGDAFARALPPEIRGRVDTTGRLDGDEAAATLRVCDLLVQPYPDGVTTRRTSMMAALTTLVPTVTTDGPLTEPVWAQSNGVALAPAGDVAAFADQAEALAADPASSITIGANGRALYDAHFALGVTIARMRR